MKSLAETHPEIAKLWHPDKNDCTPWDVSSGQHKMIWLKCDKGVWPDGTPATDHEWEIMVCRAVVHGAPCPCCNNKKAVPSNCLATTHPEIAKQWHPSKNTFTPWDVVAYSGRSAWFKCDEGVWPDGSPANDHEWEVRIWLRTKKEYGCPCCNNKKAVPSNCLATTHPEIAKQWHPSKNTFTPWDVTAGCDKKAWFKCDKGLWPDGTPAYDHEWESVIYHRTGGVEAGCPCCTRRQAVPSNSLAATHPEIAKLWHPSKNDCTPWDVVAGSDKKVWLKCDKGVWPDGTPAADHEWESTVYAVTRSGGACLCCNNKRAVPSNCLATTHPEIAKLWHPSKNDCTPWDVVAGSAKKRTFTCDNGHEFFIPLRRVVCHGCPVCTESKGEKAIRLYLERKGISHKREHRLKVGRPDFVVWRNGLCIIEFFGIQHFIPFSFSKNGNKLKCLISNLVRDDKKERWFKEKGYPLLTIPYWDIDRVDEILDDFFLGKIPVFSKPPAIVEQHAALRKKIRDKYGLA